MKKVLFPAFIVALSVGCLSLYYNIHAFDKEYSELIQKGVDQLRIIQKLTFDSNRSYILLFMSLSNDDKSKVEIYSAERLAISNRNSLILDSLLNSKSDDVFKNQIVNINKSRSRYRQKSEELLALAANDKISAMKFFNLELDPLFKSYQSDINKLYVEKYSLINSYNNTLSTSIRWNSGLILLASFISPIIFTIIISLAIIILIYSLSKNWMAERT